MNKFTTAMDGAMLLIWVGVILLVLTLVDDAFGWETVRIISIIIGSIGLIIDITARYQQRKEHHGE